MNKKIIRYRLQTASYTEGYGIFWRRMLLPITLIAVFVAVSLSADLRISQTFDEGFHLVAGYRYLQCGDFGINAEHPPLVKLVAALPLYLKGVPPPSGGKCGVERHCFSAQ